MKCWHGQYQNLEKIDFVDIYWYEKATYPLWCVPMSGFVPEISPEIVRLRINKKENRISTYLKSCDEIWLLIVIDGHSPSGNWEESKFSDASSSVMSESPLEFVIM